jgi:hypothetical protein
MEERLAQCPYRQAEFALSDGATSFSVRKTDAALAVYSSSCSKFTTTSKAMVCFAYNRRHFQHILHT